jgi:hypothetical protein
VGITAGEHSVNRTTPIAPTGLGGALHVLHWSLHMPVRKSSERILTQINLYFKTSPVSGFSCRMGLSTRGRVGIAEHGVLLKKYRKRESTGSQGSQNLSLSFVFYFNCAVNNYMQSMIDCLKKTKLRGL